MNLIGKIFTVLIFIMSLGYMFFCVMVFATHRNWKEEHKKLTTQLADLQRVKKGLEDERDRLNLNYAQELAARKAAVAAIQSRVVRFEAEVARLSAENTANASALASQTEANNTVQKRLSAMETQLASAREELRKTLEDRDKQFDLVVVRTDELNRLQGALTEMTETNAQLTSQLARTKLVLRENGLTEESLVNLNPVNLSGKILAAREDLVEISLGSDDGLKVGNTMDVFRGSTYVGRIIIKKVTADRAVGEMDAKLKKTKPQEGDNVTTKLI